MIFIIDSNEIIAECIKKACLECGKKVLVFNNAIDAMAGIDDELPNLIFIDVMLTGPDGFSFMNELITYNDTAKIPIVVVSDLDFRGIDLNIYGVVGVLKKDTLVPNDIKEYVRKYVNDKE